MTQLVPFGVDTVVHSKVLDGLNSLTKSYLTNKFLRDTSMDHLPALFGNTTETLIMTNSLLEATKYLTGNCSESLVPSFSYLLANQTGLIHAQTTLLTTQNLILKNSFKNKMIGTQAGVISGGCMLTIIGVGESICAPNMASRLCFTGAAILNGLGTLCSTVSMMTTPTGCLNPFGVLFNSLGTGCFFGAKYFRQAGNMTRFKLVP